MVLEARSLKSRCHQVLLLKPVREGLPRFFSACVGLLAIFSLPGLIDTSLLHLHMEFSLCLFTSSSFSVCVYLYVCISTFDSTSYIRVHPH